MRNSFMRYLLNIFTACILALLVATPIVLGATGDDLKEVKGGDIIYFIVDTIEGFGVSGLVILLFLGILGFFIGLILNPKAAVIGAVVFVIIYVFIVVIWLGADDIVNGFIKPLGYVLPERAT